MIPLRLRAIVPCLAWHLSVTRGISTMSATTGPVSARHPIKPCAGYEPLKSQVSSSVPASCATSEEAKKEPRLHVSPPVEQGVLRKRQINYPSTSIPPHSSLEPDRRMMARKSCQPNLLDIANKGRKVSCFLVPWQHPEFHPNRTYIVYN